MPGALLAQPVLGGVPAGNVDPITTDIAAGNQGVGSSVLGGVRHGRGKMGERAELSGHRPDLVLTCMYCGCGLGAMDLLAAPGLKHPAQHEQAERGLV